MLTMRYFNVGCTFIRCRLLSNIICLGICVMLYLGMGRIDGFFCGRYSLEFLVINII